MKFPMADLYAALGVVTATLHQNEDPLVQGALDVIQRFIRHEEEAHLIKRISPTTALVRIMRLNQELADFKALVPTTPLDVAQFVGSNFSGMRTMNDQGEKLDPMDVTYTLTVHDLLSAFSERFDG